MPESGVAEERWQREECDDGWVRVMVTEVMHPQVKSNNPNTRGASPWEIRSIINPSVSSSEARGGEADNSKQKEMYWIKSDRVSSSGTRGVDADGKWMGEREGRREDGRKWREGREEATEEGWRKDRERRSQQETAESSPYGVRKKRPAKST